MCTNNQMRFKKRGVLDVDHWFGEREERKRGGGEMYESPTCSPLQRPPEGLQKASKNFFVDIHAGLQTSNWASVITPLLFLISLTRRIFVVVLCLSFGVSE